MKKLVIIGVILILIIAGAVVIYLPTKPDQEGGDVTSGGKPSTPPSPIPAAKATPIRLAYSPYSLINAHIGQTLTHTNILENNGLKGKIKTYDTDNLLVEALKKGDLDVIFTADVPAMSALAQDYKGLIITSFGSLGRTALMVLPDSPIKKTEDLKTFVGPKIGVPFGSSAHRNLLTMLQKENLSVGQDVHLKDVSNPQRLITGLENNDFDAIMLWDPHYEQCLREKTCRNLADSQFYSVVLMASGFHNQDPQATMRFLTALKEAIYFTAEHLMEINQIVAKHSNAPPDIMASCSSINLNLRATSITRVNISLANYLPLLQRAADYIHQQKLAPKIVNLTEVTDPKIKEESARIINPDEFDIGRIKFTP